MEQYVITINNVERIHVLSPVGNRPHEIRMPIDDPNKLVMFPSGSAVRITMQTDRNSLIRTSDGSDTTIVMHDPDTYDVLSPSNGSSTVHTGDPYGNDPIRMEFTGLVSDGQLVDLSGGLTVYVSTEESELNFPVNLKPNGEDIISIHQATMEMFVERNLSGEHRIGVGFNGDITVSRVLDGSANIIPVASGTAVLSKAVLTVISDWSESTLADLAVQTLDELIYREV